MGDAAFKQDEVVSGQGGAVQVPDPTLSKNEREPGFVLGGDADTLPVEDELDAEVYPEETVEASESEEEQKPKVRFELPEATGSTPPKWVRIPKALRFPRGRSAIFLRFKAEWTDTPWKGHEMPDDPSGGLWRECICWNLTDNDEKWAFNRAANDPNRAIGALAKQMIRSIDGVVVDWTGSGGSGDIDKWWNEIGGKCRSMIMRLYSQQHVMKPEEVQLFFASCVDVRTVG